MKTASRRFLISAAALLSVILSFYEQFSFSATSVDRFKFTALVESVSLQRNATRIHERMPLEDGANESTATPMNRTDIRVVKNVTYGETRSTPAFASERKYFSNSTNATEFPSKPRTVTDKKITQIHSQQGFVTPASPLESKQNASLLTGPDAIGVPLVQALRNGSDATNDKSLNETTTMKDTEIANAKTQQPPKLQPNMSRPTGSTQRPNVSSIPSVPSVPPVSFGNKGSITPKSEELQQIGIFINAYIPLEDKRKATLKNALGIVQKQLRQISSSYAATQNITVTIATVGRGGINDSTIHELCKIAYLTCVRPPPSGTGELNTMHQLYEYCTRSPDSAKAVYIHNKGSFHPSPKNNKWRNAMTDAVVTKECLNPPNKSCNACGLQFAAPPRMFTMLFPGNFYSASCQYVKRLLPPNKYARLQRKTVIRASQSKDQGRLQFDFNPWSMGTGRYTAEHWIGSHPSIQPCDWSIYPDYWYWESHDQCSDESCKWSMWPREPFNASREFALAPWYVDKHDLRLRVYGLFAGLLFRWRYLYKAIPPESSWMWSWLPDGNFWKEAVAKYGLKSVVNIVTGPGFNRTEAGLTGHIPAGQ